MENLTLFEQFQKDCRVIALHDEYPGFVGTEKYGIVTRLSISEINEQYKSIVAEYAPFVLLTLEEGEIINEYWRNHRKHQRRQERAEDIFNFGEMTETMHSELQSDEDLLDIAIKEFDVNTITHALTVLSKKQRERTVKRFYYGMSYSEIACSEGINKNAVAKSIAQSLKIMKKFIENGCTN